MAKKKNLVLIKLVAAKTAEFFYVRAKNPKKVTFENHWKLCFISVMTIMMFVGAPVFESYAQAQPDAVTNTLCNVVNVLTGGIGKSISVIIVISLAFGLFLGKVSWGMAIGVAAAMGALFGARDLVNLISSGTASPCQ